MGDEISGSLDAGERSKGSLHYEHAGFSIEYDLFEIIDIKGSQRENSQSVAHP